MAVGELIVNIIGDMKDLHKVFSDVQKEIGNVGTKLQAAGSQISSAGSAMTSSITIPIAAVAAGVTAVTGQAVGFEKQMAEVFTLLPGISEQGMGQMSKDALALAKDMGVLPKEVVPALYQAISAGVPKENVFEFLRTSQMAAVGGSAVVKTAVDGISSVVNAYGSDTISATEASDLMFTAIRLGKTDFNELASSIYNVIPFSSKAGVAFGDVTAAIAVLTSQGTPTAQATTQIRQAIIELTDSGSNVSKVFQEITGKTFKQFIAEGGNMNEAFQLLEQYAIDSRVGVDELFGSVEAGAAVLGLTGTSAKKFAEYTDDMGNSAGATEAAYATMGESSSRALDEIKASLSVLTIELGNAFLPILKDVIVPLVKNTLIPALEKLIPIVETIAKAFGSLPAPVQVAVLAFVAFIAALGPLLIVIGSVVSAIGTIATAVGSGGVLAVAFTAAKTAIAGMITSVSALGAPLLIIIGVVALLAVAWHENWFDIQGKAKAVWDWLKSQGNALWQQLEYTYHAIIMSGSTLKQQFGAVWDAIKNAYSTISGLIVSTASGLHSSLSTVYNSIVSAVTTLFNTWRTIWNNLISATQTAASTLNAALVTLYNYVLTQFNRVRDAANNILNTWKTHWSNFQNATSSAASQLSSALSSMYSQVKARFDQIKAAADYLYNAIKTAWNNIVTSVKSAGSQLVSAISGLPTSIKNLSSAFSNAGKAILDALYDSIVSGFNKAIKKAKDLLAELRSYLPSSPAEQGPFKTLPDWSSAISQPLSKSVSEAASTAKTAGTSIISSIASGIKSAASTVYNAASSAFKKVKSLLPHSPAEEGPFSEIPNWDSIFVDPIKESIARSAELAKPLSQALGSLRSPIDSLSGGLDQVASVTNNSFAGDTISIGPNTLANSVDVRMLIEELNRYTANKRRSRGLFT